MKNKYKAWTKGGRTCELWQQHSDDEAVMWRPDDKRWGNLEGTTGLRSFLLVFVVAILVWLGISVLDL